MAVLALISELMMQSQVSAAAKRAGIPLEIASSTDALLAKAVSVQPALVIIDLSHPGIDPAQLVPQLRSSLPAGASILAFGPHVHKGLLAAAGEAGCESVISRGQFHAQLDEILKATGASGEQ